MYLRLVDGQPEAYSVGRLHRDNPDVSFPQEHTDAMLAGYNVYPYTRPAQPDVDWMTASLSDGPFEQDEAGAWVQPFVVARLPTEDASRNVRGYRDSLLQQTDWMALSDTTMTPEWAAYRQALRDVTAQEGFPFSVVWPVKPGATE